MLAPFISMLLYLVFFGLLVHCLILFIKLARRGIQTLDLIIEDKTVLITGAGRGLGFELFQAYTARQALLFPIVRTEDDAACLSGRNSDLCRPIVADLTPDSCISIISNELAEHRTVCSTV
jgi:hypothetical protein